MRLTGRKIIKLERRAKYLLTRLSGDETLLMHLGMSGRFAIYSVAEDAARVREHRIGAHDHIELLTDDGVRIVYTDHRRFGLMTLYPSQNDDAHPLLKDLGPEPLSDALSAKYLDGVLRTKKSPIKHVLLDQRVVAGLGNIYVCEALFRCGVSPLRLGRDIKARDLGPLVRSIKDVLRAALKSGGSTLRDYQQTSGELGYFQNKFRVYDREGQCCLRRGCDGRIVKTTQSGRSSYYCADCQR